MRANALVAAAITVAAIVGVGSSTASAAPNTNTTNSQKPASSSVTVQPGDNLSKIAQANNTTYVRLYDANDQVNDPDLIFPGQNLRVPADDEQLPNRPLPANAPVQQPAAPVAQTAPAAPVSRPVTYSAPAVSAATVASGSVWDQLAQCESGGNWSISTGNGFYGGLQFTMSSWAAAGGSGNPANASRDEQIARAQILQQRQGWGAWPACSAKLGL